MVILRMVEHFESLINIGTYNLGGSVVDTHDLLLRHVLHLLLLHLDLSRVAHQRVMGLFREVVGVLPVYLLASESFAFFSSAARARRYYLKCHLFTNLTHSSGARRTVSHATTAHVSPKSRYRTTSPTLYLTCVGWVGE